MGYVLREKLPIGRSTLKYITMDLLLAVMPPLLFLACITAAVTLVYVEFVRYIPEGYQDETGFHFGKQPQP